MHTENGTYTLLLLGWLSVDPLADKYPHLTSYHYCANNPIMLVDPDGRDPIFMRKNFGVSFEKSEMMANVEAVLILFEVQLQERPKRELVVIKYSDLKKMEKNEE